MAKKNLDRVVVNELLDNHYPQAYIAKSNDPIPNFPDLGMKVKVVPTRSPFIFLGGDKDIKIIEEHCPDDADAYSVSFSRIVDVRPTTKAYAVQYLKILDSC